MDLQTLWFLLIAVLLTGYFVLEGFDFGVGMLLPFIGNDARRTAAMKAIGPVWDGNEVWLITAGGAIFAAFPVWYATMFSGLYLPLLLILVGLILRGVGVEWRIKVDTVAWRKKMDTLTCIGSWIPAVLWGVAFANIAAGIPLDAEGNLNSFTDGFIGLLNPFGLLGGVAFALLFMLHGATFLGFKTHNPLRALVHNIALKGLALPTVLVGGGLVFWLQLSYGKAWTWVLVALIVVGLVAAIGALALSRDYWSFAGTFVAILCTSALIFGSIFPNVLPSSLDPANSLDIYSAASGDYTLTVMSWAALLLLPPVLLVQGWTYWVFRKRIKVEGFSQ